MDVCMDVHYTHTVSDTVSDTVMYVTYLPAIAHN